MGFGGPVWHASVSPIGGGANPQNAAWLFRIAENYLEGVGDAARGEWREVGDKAVHIRRRLSAEEEAPIGPALDLRGTAEARGRLFRFSQRAHPAMVDMAKQELGA